MSKNYVIGQAGGDRTMPESQLYATVTDIAANYVVQNVDVNTLLSVNSATPVTMTLPATLPRGACISFIQTGVGSVTLSPASGASLPQGSAATSFRYQIIAAIVIANPDGASATWVVGGV